MPALQRLWAPWRSTFLTGPTRRRCIFCAAIRSREDRKHWVIARGRQTFAMLNLYPYNNGHVMVAPRRHVGELDALTAAEWAELGALSQRVTRTLRAKLRPHGFNIGMNVGRAAGAGFPGHLHLHIVPLWNGDTNFMPVASGTKVISQSLRALYTLLHT